VGRDPAGELLLQARREVVGEGRVRGDAVQLGRIMGAPHLLQPAIVAVAEDGGDDQRRAQISTWLPSSTTRFGGSLKNSIALSALRSIQANRRSRQIAIPGRDEASRVWRARKKPVSIILNAGPHCSTLASASGTSDSCMKPKRRIRR